MRPSHELRQILARIDGRGYKAYQDIKGSYDFSEYILSIDHVQGDPFAAPSRLSVRVPMAKAAFPPALYANKIRKIALGDFLARAFDQAIEEVAKGRRGTGRSGLFMIDAGGQEILERSAVVIEQGFVEARFTMGLPAAGRTVLGRQAEEMFFQELPQIVRRALFYRHLPAKKLEEHVQVVEDQEALRIALKERGLVAFVGNGSTLPRRSGIDDRPLVAGRGEVVVPFQSPPDLEVELLRPNLGPIRGMGIPKGVTLIVGGGFHGKSTLLRALERGVYNHIPGDGREWAITIPEAVKIRAEDGRFVEKVDISPFISHLPFGKDTTIFSTENASGSTSQAANIMEALEMGAKLLLIDEDTSATNFMIRDARMQALVAKAKEPITPFVDKVRQLYHEYGVSTILVMGGSGDYFDQADTILMMDEYRPVHVTKQAKEIIKEFPTRRQAEGGERFGKLPHRRPLPESFDPSRGSRDVKIDAKGLKSILFGTTSIDLSALEQLVDLSQTRAIGEAIYYYATRYAARGFSLREGLERLMEDLEKGGLDILSPFKVGNLARPRVFEIAFAINRMRSLKIQ
ncbi:MAG: ABC-ATPase domain-containing protein [Candidatus Methylomirabilales bacterium]